MKRVISRSWPSLLLLSGLGLGASDAGAAVTPSSAYPPDGWDHLCSGALGEPKLTVTSRSYTASGTCWINLYKDKSDGDNQVWALATATLEASYDIPSNKYQEKININWVNEIAQVFSLKKDITSSGTCTDDPWATSAQCAPAKPSIDVFNTFGWSMNAAPGPLSRNVFGASLISALLSKKLSKPPLAPVDVEAVRVPAFDGKGFIGRVFWRAPDVSDNKWIMRYDIEWAMNSPNGAFATLGAESGPGTTSQLSSSETIKFYYSNVKLQAADYYFRVCSVNDAGRQCTAPLKAREQTTAEKMAGAGHTTAAGGKLGSGTGSSGGNTNTSAPTGVGARPGAATSPAGAAATPAGAAAAPAGAAAAPPPTAAPAAPATPALKRAAPRVIR